MILRMILRVLERLQVRILKLGLVLLPSGREMEKGHMPDPGLEWVFILIVLLIVGYLLLTIIPWRMVSAME